VEPFDRAGGGRAADAGAQVGDAALAAAAVEQHLGWVGAEPAGEHLAVVGEDFLGGAVAGQGGGEDPADGAGGGPLDEPGSDTEPGVVIDPGHGLELAAIAQPDPAHDVQLPQLHRPGAFPAPGVGLGTPTGVGLGAAVADQGPVAAGQPGRWIDAVTGQPVGEAALTPAGMAPAQLAEAGLDRGRHLLRAAIGSMGAVGQGLQSAVGVAA
jgi:hypothetical protein